MTFLRNRRTTNDSHSGGEDENGKQTKGFGYCAGV